MLGLTIFIVCVVIYGGVKLYVREGKAVIRVKLNDLRVFYNPRASFNRSFGVLAVSLEGSSKGNLVVADALAASGVRGLRYFLESGVVERVYLNDLSNAAYQIIKFNVELNGLVEKAVVSRMDANVFMSSRIREGDKFDFLDVDPYGSPAPFIDNAVSSVRDGGLLAVTATDLPPLCGLYPVAAFRKYGGFPLRGEFCHEVASRLVIYLILEACGRRGRVPRILSTTYTAHYVRVYVRLFRGKKGFPIEKVGFIYRCPRCGEVYSTPFESNFLTNCLSCGVKLKVSGPLWTGELHSKEFISNLLKYIDRIAVNQDKRRMYGFIKTLLEEIDYPPYHFDVSKASKSLKISTPSILKVIDCLRSMGYKASRTHFNPVGVKTNASYRRFLEAVELASKA